MKATSTISLPWRNKQRERMTDKREPPVSRLAALFYSCGRKMEAYRFRNHSILCWFSNGRKMVFFTIERPEQMCYNDFENVLEDKEEGVTEA